MTAEETHRHKGPGCGIGLYAILLLVIFLVGLTGMIGGTIGLLNSEPDEARSLVHGSEVQVWRLQPMREVGLLELTEVPAAWHDESPRFDGTTACVLTQEGVGRIEPDKHWFFAWTDIVNIDAESEGKQRLRINLHTATDSFGCGFGPNEGADRFLRQVEAERQRLEPASSEGSLEGSAEGSTEGSTED